MYWGSVDAAMLSSLLASKLLQQKAALWAAHHTLSILNIVLKAFATVCVIFSGRRTAFILPCGWEIREHPVEYAKHSITAKTVLKWKKAKSSRRRFGIKGGRKIQFASPNSSLESRAQRKNNVLVQSCQAWPAEEFLFGSKKSSMLTRKFNFPGRLCRSNKRRFLLLHRCQPTINHSLESFQNLNTSFTVRRLHDALIAS